jgi:aminoglycoside phosphotransferase (APT) family kinase protein
MNNIDQATTIRSGEELDSARVEAFFRDSFPDLNGEMTIRQFPCGNSNLTYLVTIGDRELVLRRPPFGKKAKTAHDMGREYKILSAIHPVYSYAPRPLVFSEDTSVLGSPFYVMERKTGIIVRKDLPSGHELSALRVRELFENLLKVQYELHGIDYKKIRSYPAGPSITLIFIIVSDYFALQLSPSRFIIAIITVRPKTSALRP